MPVDDPQLAKADMEFTATRTARLERRSITDLAVALFN
jgi:hypothetical protein